MNTFYKSFSTTYRVLILFLTLIVSISLSSQVMTKPDNDKDPVKDTSVQGSKDDSSDIKSDVAYEPVDIADALAPEAVTYQDMELRAKYHPYVPGEIVVAMELETSRSKAASVLGQFNWQGLFSEQGVKLSSVLMKVDRGSSHSVSLVLLTLPEGLEVFEAMKKLEGKSGILWSSPNFYFEGDPREVVPNDPDYALQYHHPLMNNHLAWDITFGSSSIIVAVTDDGVELTHSDLAPNIWVNTGEIPGNGIDDDGNGYIDDVNGWDFSNGNNNPNPNQLSHNHGTHVAGIAAARTNNAIGVAGVSGHSTIMPLQFYNYINWTAAMINETFTYAADNGAKIVNTSYNIDGWVGDPVFTAGLQYLYDAGVLHINSAGNNNQLNPPRQAFHQTLLVASTDAADVKSSFSNYGAGVDISAPGSSIYSTVTGNGYNYNSGTSMAAPNAAGAAALIWSANPTWTRDQVAAQLLATADNIDAANPTRIGLLGSGRVNTYAALTTVLAAPQIKSTVGLPDEGTIISTIDLTSFSVAFDQVMNPTTVNDLANFELRNAGPNGIFGDGDDVIHPLTTTTIYQIGTNQITFQISDLPLQCGLHRLTLVSGGLENPFGADLDGDGNGTGGDHYVRNFSVIDNYYYFDGDGDGYGAGAPLAVCSPPSGYVLLDGDCDDNDPLINPGATEVCDGVDNNCDGIIDFPEVATYPSTNVPLAISTSGTPTVSSTITISGATGTITDLNVKDLNILHSWVGDLKATLTSPGGTVFNLFDRPGRIDSGFGCSQNNILATFDDEAALTADDFENTCNSSNSAATYAISGTYQSIDPLFGLIGTDPNGTWILTISDFADGDGGSLEGWGLEIHYPEILMTYYADADGDSYGDPNVSLELGCTPDPSLGWVLDNTDCDDTNPDINPGATEVCDGVDNNCDGQIDEGGICCTGDTIYFVNDDAVGLNDGSSWTDAFTDLQSALNSTCPDITEIWVAAGTYYPTSDTDRNISFVLKNGIAVYGGFDGTEDPLTFDLADRDFVANETILSGEIGDPNSIADNSYHVVIAAGLGITSTSVVDGFTVRDGNAIGSDDGSFGRGGGMLIWYAANPVINNCIIRENSAAGGAGMSVESNSSPTISNCNFTDNTSTGGGAGMIIAFGSSPSIYNCTFSGNSSGDFGGAISIFSSGTNPIIQNSSFINNTSTGIGGGISSIFYADPQITNCVFQGNSSSYGGGLFNDNSSPVITNCSFSGNSASISGGGMQNANNSSPTVINCSFYGNSVPEMDGSYAANLNGSQEVPPNGSLAGGTGNFTYDLVSRQLTWNIAHNVDSPSAAHIHAAAAGQNGPVQIPLDLSANPMVGSAILTEAQEEMLFNQLLYVNIHTPLYPGGEIRGQILPAVSSGGIVNSNFSSPVISNSILWGNGGGITNDFNSTPDVTYSIVQGGYVGTGNLDQDPLFVNGAEGNLRLEACSPAIDAGNNAVAPDDDLDGNTRPFDPFGFGAVVDMGAYEFSVITNYCDVCEAVAGTLTKSPDEEMVCEGSDVSATISGGLYGNGTDEVEFRTHDGSAWSAWAEYTSGTAISTAGIAEVEIRTRRLSDNCEPSAYETIGWLVQWPPVAFAGQDASIFPGENYLLSDATATGNSSILWETSGDGSFDDASAQNPTYMPGPNDKLTGSVELSISLEDMNLCGFTDIDQMMLTIYRPPTIAITSPFDGDVFYDNPVSAEGTAADPDGDLTEVYLRVNSGLWALATGTDNWTIDLALAAGENLIQAKAVDAQGLESAISEITVILSIQIISIPQGWSLISSYLTPNDPAIEVVMQDVSIPENLTIMLGLNGLFWPAYGINTIGNWNVFEGYKVKYQQPVELTIRGNKMNDNSVTFPEGFHIIPVLSNVPSLISEIFTDPANDLKYMFDLTSGQIYWPLGGISTLTELTPGKGYLANFNKQVTLNFPDYQTLKSSAVANNYFADQTGPWTYSKTGEAHFISLFADATATLEQYTYIGAFNSEGYCIGLADIAAKGQNILLTVYGNDPYTETRTGAEAGEQITFKAWNSADGLSSELVAVFDPSFPNHDGTFAINGLSAIVDFKESTTGTGTSALISQISVYPNPADDQVTIAIPGNKGEISFTVMEVDGKSIVNSSFTGSQFMLDVSDFKPGIYMIRLEIGGEIFTRRLVVL